MSSYSDIWNQAIAAAAKLVRDQAKKKEKEGCGCYYNPNCTCDYIPLYLDDVADQIDKLEPKEE